MQREHVRANQSEPSSTLLGRRLSIFVQSAFMRSKHAKIKLEQNVIGVFIAVGVLNIAFMWSWGIPMVNCLQLMTMSAFLLILFCFLGSESATVVRSEPVAINERPIIGVLSQEQAYHLTSLYAKENFTSYIAASYVKDIEASGARVVPILIGKNREYYKELLEKINGVLFPGGGTYFNQSNGYADAGQHIYELAMEMNDAGDYFPVFGTCLGFELLVILASGRGEIENRVTCKAYCNSALNFTSDFRSSKMFKEIDNDLVRMFEHEHYTANAHKFCIVDENMERHNLSVDWRVTSYSEDENQLRYISSIEHKRYPFYGVQFHPEKASFEWKKSRKYPHSINAIKVNRYFMDFFVEECRKSIHSFKNEEEENSYLIYNYAPYFTGKNGSMYNQCYFFEPKGTNVE
ncbi:gamma-glutamyl hydrolase A-like isoform X1 [Ostrinia nubilalis]|uniref:gamma-glutamyl hydrolase A-like isoform X1 n=2 Tax=Ostrinia nubilalis TaxID=29057 RepID=UPI0030822CD3